MQHLHNDIRSASHTDAMSSFVKLWSAHLAAQIKVEQLRLVADVVAGIQSKFIACFSNSNKLVLNTCSADGGL